VKLTNEFTVAVPIERAWETLLDIEQVAGFLPGATIQPSSEDGVFNGSMRVKVGPMVVNYEGTARLVATDEQEHVAELAVQARDTQGQGTASAVIRNRLVPDEGGTRVIAETDLSITGRQAQFGRGIMQDIAGRMLDDFAQRFEAHLAAGDRPDTAINGASEGGPEPSPQGREDALDLGSVVLRSAGVRSAGLALLAGLVIALLVLARRRARAGNPA
jgi:hypothetical protein